MASVLIVSEKVIAARRIAEVLSGGKAKAGKHGSIPLYRFVRDGDEYVSVGLKGHIMRVDFPDEYAKWSRKTLETLVDAPIVKVPSEPEYVAALQAQAKNADRIVIATDFDREGELIGADAIAKIRQVAKTAEIRRARFSALTTQEVERAFADLEEPYASLANAGEARQDIDLIWGAVLTRYLSLVASKRGHDFLSAGRVQTPTLVLIARRELERRAFVPEPYWTIDGRFAKGPAKFVAPHATERFKTEADAKAVMGRVSGADSAVVADVNVARRTQAPPAPFNTTSLMAAAASVGLSPKRTMNAAESLYMDGYISYPRTDNTVYPPSLELRPLVEMVAAVPAIAADARKVLALPKLQPTRGAKETTDHPPVYPTGAPNLEALRPDQKKVYELVARRFLATLSPPAQIDATKVRLDVAAEPFVASGQRIAVEGWLGVYPYARQREAELPALVKGETIAFEGATLESKETKPPARYSAGVLIQEMEKLGLGTKATRHDIIQTLYDRGYVEGDPIAPTHLGMTVAEVMISYGGAIAGPDMTAALESSMDDIVAGRAFKEPVVDESRSGLHRVMTTLMGNWDQVREEVKAGVLVDSTIGTCPKCGRPLVVRSSRKGGRFAGCSGYPECDQTFPLPATGKLEPLDEACPECGSPRVAVTAPRSRTATERCINPSCPTNFVEPVPIGTCPNCRGTLLLMHSPKSGKRFVRCENYDRETEPCKTSYPVPQSGEIEPTAGVCEPCGSPKVIVQTRRGPWEICLDPACTTKTQRKSAPRAKRKAGARARTSTRRSS